MARVATLVPELMFASRVEATLRAAGHEVEAAPSLEAIDSGQAIDLLIADLDAVDSSQLTGHGLPVLGFYSHVDADTRRRAEAAGVDLVVPRSRMARQMPRLVQSLLSS